MLGELPGEGEIAVRIGGRWSRRRPDDTGPGEARAILPGSFHPLHPGHRRMAEIGEEMLGMATEFELSVANVDKSPLPLREVLRRAAQFPPDQTIWVTRAATFAEKAELFPECIFLVGADTIARVADPRYYAGSVVRRDAAVDRVVAAGCRFLVFGRLMHGRFHRLADLPLPARLQEICQAVSPQRFRVDISSTQLRAERK